MAPLTVIYSYCIVANFWNRNPGHATPLVAPTNHALKLNHTRKLNYEYHYLNEKFFFIMSEVICRLLS